MRRCERALPTPSWSSLSCRCHSQSRISRPRVPIYRKKSLRALSAIFFSFGKIVGSLWDFYDNSRTLLVRVVVNFELSNFQKLLIEFSVAPSVFQLLNFWQGKDLKAITKSFRRRIRIIRFSRRIFLMNFYKVPKFLEINVNLKKNVRLKVFGNIFVYNWNKWISYSQSQVKIDYFASTTLRLITLIY